MTATQLRNAKINAVVELQVRYNRLAKGLTIDGCDKVAIEKSLNRIRDQIQAIETELALIG
jgi:hypothetical protein